MIKSIVCPICDCKIMLNIVTTSKVSKYVSADCKNDIFQINFVILNNQIVSYNIFSDIIITSSTDSILNNTKINLGRKNYLKIDKFYPLDLNNIKSLINKLSGFLHFT